MHFDETMIWQKAAVIARIIFQLLPVLPQEERFGLRSQMSRASISISSNIAEGWSRETQRDRLNFMVIAQGSLSELQSQVRLCIILDLMAKSDVAAVLDEIGQLSRMLTTLRRKMRKSIMEEYEQDGRRIPYRYRKMQKPPPSSKH